MPLGRSVMNGRNVLLKFISVSSALVGYGSLIAFLYLISVQIYKWLHDGEWFHLGMGDGLRIGLVHCCVKDGASGRLAELLQWWESPASWLGLHKVMEVVPASLALFLLSMVGNSLFIFCRDRLDGVSQATRAAP